LRSATFSQTSWGVEVGYRYLLELFYVVN
jgi:hypothetical protein